MAKEFSRSQRMGEQIRRELAELVRDELKDPRLTWVSFTAINLSRDLGHANVYFSVLNPDDHKMAAELLNNAAGFLRHHLAARVRARTTPELKFIYDDSLERGASMDALIAKARASDSDSNE
jgi:ribosome-binding factor A